MSRTLHAFRDYAYECKNDCERIVYIDDRETDICASNWVKCIQPILDKASELTNSKIYISVYDCFEDAELAKNRKLDVVDPELFTLALEAVRAEIAPNEDEISNDMLYYLDDILLPRVRDGLYLVEERD